MKASVCKSLLIEMTREEREFLIEAKKIIDNILIEAESVGDFDTINGVKIGKLKIPLNSVHDVLDFVSETIDEVFSKGGNLTLSESGHKQEIISGITKAKHLS